MAKETDDPTDRRPSDTFLVEAAPDTPVTSPDTPPVTSPDTPVTSMSRDEIERRAYQRFVERGGMDGADIEDWLRAERELLMPRVTES